MHNTTVNNIQIVDFFNFSKIPPQNMEMKTFDAPFLWNRALI